MNTPRLVPGAALVAVPGRGLALRTPDGAFLRVDTGEVPAAELLRLFDGGAAVDTGAPRAATGALKDLVRAFQDAGYATAHPPREPAAPRPPLAGTTVLLLGDRVLTEPVARLAADAGARPEAVDADRLTERARTAGPRSAVVWCLDRPVPPGLWDAADALARNGVAWLRCHREGAHAWVEPPALDADGVTSADVRLRRLAATPAHRELNAYWAAQHGGDGAGHSAVTAAYTAALLVGDLVDGLGDRARRTTGPHRFLLRQLDLRDLALTTHPILPVPACTPMPTPAAAP
ncbi:hypothetical protein ACH41E_04885 [Streptomyces sp. NPDC020412]|uniref:hypothetical protein n=1 Tax=Streptomyces sp. NPDC020412 TaxID=3365073 RepID=UPI003792F5AB